MPEQQSPEHTEDYQRIQHYSRLRAQDASKQTHEYKWYNVPCTAKRSIHCTGTATIREDGNPAEAECNKCWSD